MIDHTARKRGGFELFRGALHCRTKRAGKSVHRACLPLYIDVECAEETLTKRLCREDSTEKTAQTAIIDAGTVRTGKQQKREAEGRGGKQRKEAEERPKTSV